MLTGAHGVRAAEVLMQADMDVRIRETLGDGVNPIAFSGQTVDGTVSDEAEALMKASSGRGPA